MADALSPVATTARKRQGSPISVLTAYDYPGARLLEEAGVDWVLVGDSLGMVVLGYPDTTHVTLADMVHHTRAAARGLTHTPLIADLPVGAYETPAQAVANARILLEAGAHAVKLEGGASHSAHIKALSDAGIPAMGHIGMLPQSVLKEGGYHLKGKTTEACESLLRDARALEDAGAFALVVELVQNDCTRQIREAVQIPIIGIGSGPACDGQVLVLHDLTGAFPWFRPKFATALASVGDDTREAARQFIKNLKNR